MPSFNYFDLFGQNAATEETQGFPLKIIIDTGSFKDENHAGELPNGIGLSTDSTPSATQIFYGLVMLLMQNQGAKIDTDPQQKIWVADAGKSIATGTRDGQVKRSFTVSFFIDANLSGIPSIDQIDS